MPVQPTKPKPYGVAYLDYHQAQDFVIAVEGEEYEKYFRSLWHHVIEHIAGNGSALDPRVIAVMVWGNKYDESFALSDSGEKQEAFLAAGKLCGHFGITEEHTDYMSDLPFNFWVDW